MATLQKLDIVAMGRLKTEPVQLDNGDEIIISEMGAVDNYALFSDPRFKTGAEAALMAPAMLVRCIVDQDGNRIFGNEDEPVVSRFPKPLFDSLLAVAMRLNGIGDAAHEATVKNSEPSPG